MNLKTGGWSIGLLLSVFILYTGTPLPSTAQKTGPTGIPTIVIDIVKGLANRPETLPATIRLLTNNGGGVIKAIADQLVTGLDDDQADIIRYLGPSASTFLNYVFDGAVNVSSKWGNFSGKTRSQLNTDVVDGIVLISNQLADYIENNVDRPSFKAECKRVANAVLAVINNLVRKDTAKAVGIVVKYLKEMSSENLIKVLKSLVGSVEPLIGSTVVPALKKNQSVLEYVKVYYKTIHNSLNSIIYPKKLPTNSTIDPQTATNDPLIAVIESNLHFVVNSLLMETDWDDTASFFYRICEAADAVLDALEDDTVSGGLLASSNIVLGFTHNDSVKALQLINTLPSILPLVLKQSNVSLPSGLVDMLESTIGSLTGPSSPNDKTPITAKITAAASGFIYSNLETRILLDSVKYVLSSGLTVAGAALDEQIRYSNATHTAFRNITRPLDPILKWLRPVIVNTLPFNLKSLNDFNDTKLMKYFQETAGDLITLNGTILVIGSLLEKAEFIQNVRQYAPIAARILQSIHPSSNITFADFSNLDSMTDGEFMQLLVVKVLTPVFTTTHFSKITGFIRSLLEMVPSVGWAAVRSVALLLDDLLQENINLSSYITPVSYIAPPAVLSNVSAALHRAAAYLGAVPQSDVKFLLTVAGNNGFAWRYIIINNVLSPVIANNMETVETVVPLVLKFANIVGMTNIPKASVEELESWTALNKTTKQMTYLAISEQFLASLRDFLREISLSSASTRHQRDEDLLTLQDLTDVAVLALNVTGTLMDKGVPAALDGIKAEVDGWTEKEIGKVFRILLRMVQSSLDLVIAKYGNNSVALEYFRGVVRTGLDLAKFGLSLSGTNLPGIKPEHIVSIAKLAVGYLKDLQNKNITDVIIEVIDNPLFGELIFNGNQKLKGVIRDAVKVADTLMKHGDFSVEKVVAAAMQTNIGGEVKKVLSEMGIPVDIIFPSTGNGTSKSGQSIVISLVLKQVQSWFNNKLLALQAHATASPQCLSDLSLFVNSIPYQSPWALQMLDAMAKPESGIFQGKLRFLGDFDECVKVDGVRTWPYKPTDSHFKAHWCETNIPTSRFKPLAPLAALAPQISVGLCLPRTCSNTTIQALLTSMSNTTAPSSVDCAHDPDISQDSFAIVTIIVFSFFAAVILFATLFDGIVLVWYDSMKVDKLQEKINNGGGDYEKLGRVSKENGGGPHINGGFVPSSDADHHEMDQLPKKHVDVVAVSDRPPKDHSAIIRVIQAFSFYTNASKVLNFRHGKGSLRAIHGLRFLNMAWIIMGHTYSTAFSPYVAGNMVTEPNHLVKSWIFQPIMNGTFSVDTFFVISGFLVTFLLLKRLDKSNGKLRVKEWVIYYVHRYWRLTPYLAALMLFVAGLGPYFGNGPFNKFRDFTVKPCVNNWWTNILYINNLVEGKSICLGQTWYLSNDMQFYVLAPIFILLLYWVPTIGVAVTIASICISMAVTAIIVGPKVSGKESSVLVLTKIMDTVYIKPWCRIQSYLVGVLAGYIMVRTKDRLVRMSKITVTICWTFFTIVGLSTLFIRITESHNGIFGEEITIWPKTWTVIYEASSRTVWSVVIAWVIIACASGKGGIMDTLLGWEGFLPWSRLTYGAYLIHMTMQAIFFINMRQLRYLSPTEQIWNFCGNLLISYLAALVTSLAFEAPFMALDKIILGGGGGG